METLIIGLIGIGGVTAVLDIVVSFAVRLIAPEWHERVAWGGQ